MSCSNPWRLAPSFPSPKTANGMQGRCTALELLVAVQGQNSSRCLESLPFSSIYHLCTTWTSRLPPHVDPYLKKKKKGRLKGFAETNPLVRLFRHNERHTRWSCGQNEDDHRFYVFHCQSLMWLRRTTFHYGICCRQQDLDGLESFVGFKC
jgi:hypothetical protein